MTNVNEIRKELRRKPFWRVADFARYMGLTHKQARARLRRYNEELGGMLLRRSRGTNRVYGLYWAALAKHDPEAFLDDPLEQQRRVDAIEEVVDGLGEAQRIIALQVGQTTRDIARIRARRLRAA